MWIQDYQSPAGWGGAGSLLLDAIVNLGCRRRKSSIVDHNPEVRTAESKIN